MTRMTSFHMDISGDAGIIKFNTDLDRPIDL
jgi:hypothetical protein